MRRLALAIPFLALALAACQQPAQPAKEEAAKEALGPEAKPGLVLSEGRLVLNAVKGNPGAAYFTLANNSDKPVTLAAVFIEGTGRAEMHETSGESMAPLKPSELAPGAALKFEPGGKHVMAFDLDPKLAPGGSAEMTLTFSDGDKLSAPLKVESAGGMGGMEHGH
jgi:copper(I)-binding protein